ncbi:YfiR family protein [Sulfuricurvum sp.]|uniref:YfiR family protein n=1 Tax=Sulfuricurvum sp. TaxID=2025608 RepID=UPI0026221079|nr:YfiR family protein [Sulfuricurvum sp.]MDD4883988.1 YfiR family protein [Sulfuricurvum sp.]
MKFLKSFLILSVVCWQMLRADALPENTLKAAYLYNFALLTDWPKGDKSENFNLCFFRENLGTASDVLQNKMLHNQKLKVLTVTNAQEAKECKMLFIPESEEQRGEKVIQKLAGTPVLVITENMSFADTHIMIVRDNRKLAFDVNLQTFKNTDLDVSSRLLKLARKVEP